MALSEQHGSEKTRQASVWLAVWRSLRHVDHNLSPGAKAGTTSDVKLLEVGRRWSEP